MNAMNMRTPGDSFLGGSDAACENLVFAPLKRMEWIYDPYLLNIKTVEQIKNQVETLYKLKKGKNYKGFCGLYVAFQLRALGIFQENRSFYGNGNTWYRGVGKQHLAQNYVLKKYPGINCLENILRENGSPVYNIVLCTNNGRYGHVLFIHAIISGKMYFTDSFRFHNIEAGRLHAMTIPCFKNRYLDKGHTFLGALHFKEKTVFY
jgi:hypothetical protein